MGKHQGEVESRLSIYTLGQFEVRLGGVVRTTDSRSSKMWDLLKFLVTHRDRSVAPEVLVEALWPDDDYDDAKGALRTLVYRLRKVLAPEKGMPDCILSLGGGYKFVIEAVDYLDAEEFERVGAEGLQNKSLQALEQAASLYRGDYLKDSVFVEWAIPRRTYYRRLYLKIIGELVSTLRIEQNYERAEEVCEQSLLIESLDEGLNCHFLELLISQGKHTKAQEHYSAFTGRLYRDMGIKPSPALRSLYEKIKQGQNEAAATREPREVTDGALVCASDLFAGICDIESQRGQRNGYSVFLLDFALDTTAGSLSPSLGDKILELLVKSLRKGDAVARHDGDSFSILLSNLANTHAEMVVNRLYEKIVGLANTFGVKVQHSYKQL